MRQSQLFTKTRREAPADETAKNAKLLIRAGYIHKEMAGVYSYLPLGLMVIKKIENIIREEMESLGSREIIMSTLQNKITWEKTDRWNDENVDVWFKSKLQGGNEVGFGWSHEEPITEMMRSHIASYQDLPQALHQFQNKLRNEVRAKSGIIRCREFIMKDMYYFAATEEENANFYNRSIEAYKNIFEKIGLGNLTFITAASGGVFTDQFSHEFQTVCETGEDVIYVNQKENIAVNEEIFNAEKGGFEKKKTVEVGNIFNFGAKKSEQMGLYFKDKTGSQKPAFLSSYGIGVTRLMGVLAEILSDDKGIIWPESVAPFRYHLIEIASENPEVRKIAGEIYQSADGEALYDDRDLRAGEKFADADLLGIPKQVIVSERGAANGTIEIKDRKSGEVKIVSLEEFKKGQPSGNPCLTF